jgi:hypothetical protein
VADREPRFRNHSVGGSDAADALVEAATRFVHKGSRQDMDSVVGTMNCHGGPAKVVITASW